MHPCFFNKRKQNYAYKKRQKCNSLGVLGINVFPPSPLSIVLFIKKRKKTDVSAGSGRSHHAAQLLVALACDGCAALSSADRSISTPKETKKSNQKSLSF